MKKTIAILMCVLMLAGATIACFADTTTPAKAAGPLAITEINNAPDNEMFEYIEVVNTGSAAVNLKDYYIYRFAFSNGGTYLYSGILQMFGVGGYLGSNDGIPKRATNAKIVKLSLETRADVELGAGKVAVLWLAPSTAKDKTVDDFKAYWDSKGANVANANVIKVAVYSSSGIDLYPSNQAKIDGVDTTTGPNANSGITFLPDKQAGFVISLINKSFAATDDITAREYDKTLARHAAADSEVMVYTFPSDKAEGKSLEYYNFIDKAKLEKAYEGVTFDETKYTYKTRKADPAEISNGFMTAKRAEADKENVYIFADAAQCIAFPNQPGKTEATPGGLLEGQIGYSAATAYTAKAPETTAPETTAPETTAPETTKAPETTAPAPAAPTPHLTGLSLDDGTDLGFQAGITE